MPRVLFRTEDGGIVAPIAEFLAVKCPKCGAEIGRPCNGRRRLRTSVHAERLAEFRHHGKQIEPPDVIGEPSPIDKLQDAQHDYERFAEYSPGSPQGSIGRQAAVWVRRAVAAEKELRRIAAACPVCGAAGMIEELDLSAQPTLDPELGIEVIETAPAKCPNCGAARELIKRCP